MSSDGYRRFSVTILISIICLGQLWKTCNHPIMKTDTETDTDSRRFRNQVEERRYMERTSYENENENNPNLVQFSRIFDFLRDFYF